MKFDNVTWQIDGMSEPGIYPIVPIKNDWGFGNKGRMKRRLQVSRQQFALAPAYAMTAYSIQGMTLLKAVINICFSALASVIQGYIAMSRVQTREDIIIMQPFRKEPFQRGVSIENQIMMAHFRRQFDYRDELLDLHVLRITVKSVCTWCNKSKSSKSDFTLYENYCDERQISKSRDTLRCNKCLKVRKKKFTL